MGVTDQLVIDFNEAARDLREAVTGNAPPDEVFTLAQRASRCADKIADHVASEIRERRCT